MIIFLHGLFRNQRHGASNLAALWKPVLNTFCIWMWCSTKLVFWCHRWSHELLGEHVMNLSVEAFLIFEENEPFERLSVFTSILPTVFSLHPINITLIILFKKMLFCFNLGHTSTFPTFNTIVGKLPWFIVFKDFDIPSCYMILILIYKHISWQIPH